MGWALHFTNIAPLLYYLRRRSPGPPFKSDPRQAGERGANKQQERHHRKCSEHHCDTDALARRQRDEAGGAGDLHARRAAPLGQRLLADVGLRHPRSPARRRAGDWRDPPPRESSTTARPPRSRAARGSRRGGGVATGGPRRREGRAHGGRPVSGGWRIPFEPTLRRLTSFLDNCPLGRVAAPRRAQDTTTPHSDGLATPHPLAVAFSGVEAGSHCSHRHAAAAIPLRWRQPPRPPRPLL